MVNSRRIEGIGHQVKGAIMESIGVAIGDAKLAADGSAERAIGDAKNTASVDGDLLVGIDTDRIIGIGHQIKGALIQELGRIVGNTKLQSDGIAEQHVGKEQNIAGGGRDTARQALERGSAMADTKEKVASANNEPQE